MTRSNANALLARLASNIFGPHPLRHPAKYELRRDYRTRMPNADQISKVFTELGPSLFDDLVAMMPDLTAELTRSVCESGVGGLHVISEHGWILAHHSDIVADLRLTTGARKLVIGIPGYYLLRNLDPEPVSLRLYPLCGSIEQQSYIDLELVRTIVVQPGSDLVLDGFSYVPVYERAGQLLIVVGTVPLVAYQAMYSLETGERLGLFSADLPLSSVMVALRTFASAGWPHADRLARRAADSGTKEGRWAALNYAWCADSLILDDLLSELLNDPEQELRAMARNCITNLGRNLEQRTPE